MNQEKLKRLELNLSKSAIKAKPGSVRYKYGLSEEDQGFAELDILPLFTYKEDRKVIMAEFLEDYKNLELDHAKLKESHEALQKQLKDYQESENNRHLELNKKIEKLSEVINALLHTV